MVEVGPLHRFATVGAAAQAAVDRLGAGVAADRRRKLSADDTFVLNVIGLLAAADGLAEVPELPTAPAARLLAPAADAVRADLRRLGVLA